MELTKKELFLFNTNFFKSHLNYNPGIDIIKKIQSKETGAYLTKGYYEHKFIFSFRGTDSIKDIIFDSLFWKHTIPYGNKDTKIRIHDGFMRQYLSIRESIFYFIRNNYIDNFTNDVDHSITIIGHSLGAALATLCILDLQYNFPDVKTKGIVFGSPRVGNREFEESFYKRDIDFLNIQNRNDLITMLPFRWMGYEHVWSINYLDKKSHVSIKKHLNYDFYL